MHEECILIHYNEIGLKKGNRRYFENKLRKNILLAASDLGVRAVRRLWGRMLVTLSPDAEQEQVLSALQKVFGIAYFAPARLLAQDIEAMEQAAVEMMADKTFASFKVATRRANKNFPLQSVEVNRRVGARVQQASGAAVDLSDPDCTVHIEIFDDSALVYVDRVEGPGGLPVGVSNKAVLLLSSGIDSPVAGYQMLKRGVDVIYVHFHSAPYTSPASIRNTKKLVELLTTYQYRSYLYLVPFLEIQQAITSVVPASYRVIMYRRAMFYLAERIALRHRANALITGENVGQVASQTLPNIRAINEPVRLPVLRPLCGFDKQEIIERARKIGTYDISIQPYEDCCSLFVPDRPETKASMKTVLEFDQKLDLKPYYQSALQSAEKHKLTTKTDHNGEEG